MSDRSDIDIRITQPSEYRAAADVFRAALMFEPTKETELDEWLPSWDASLSITSWDGDRCVGHAASFRFDTLVPGGAWLKTSAVTRVGVLPTHTRRGLLTNMMHRLLVESRAEGMVIASLRASESVIYRRFGYGLGGLGHNVKIDATRMRPLTGTAPGSFRLVPATDALATVADLYGRLPHRVGAVTRPSWMLSRSLDGLLKGTKPHHVVVHTSPDGVDDGYAHYGVKWGEGRDAGHGVGEVFDLFGATPAVELALWGYLFDVDLVRTWTSENRPADDPILFAAHDTRSYQVTERWDEQWVRLLDVEACLSARVYDDGAPVTIAVSDPWFPDNCDTFEVGPAGVRRVSDAADITTDIAGISAAYLGGISWHSLAGAGRLQASSPDAIHRADRLFANLPVSWCGTFF